jgi:diadenosine tetraphosphate (Ap4A) HIT family hydrolase
MGELSTDCLSCNTVSGLVHPPGGIIYENNHWIVFLGAGALSVPQGYIVLKRHCEEMRELTPGEASTLGMVMKHTTQVFTVVLRPARVHLGLYAEVVRHIHWHVIPRLSNMPAGNIPLTLLIAWNRSLQRLGLKQVCPDNEVATLAAKMKLEFQRLEAAVL